MCLLLVSFQIEPRHALVIGANRDERYDRPATPVALRSTSPRVLAGRDEEELGTWLAVNEAGVVAGLTNQPTGAGRDPTKRTRGELPFLLVAHKSAADAVDALIASVDPTAYNPCSILVGDRETLFSLEIGSAPEIEARPLGPGRYALENRPFGVPTPKVRFTLAELDALATDLDAELLAQGLAAILSDHTPAPIGPDDRDTRPPERRSACVHGGRGGTRSSMIVLVERDEATIPRVLAADGPPCTTPYHDVTALWG